MSCTLQSSRLTCLGKKFQGVLKRNGEDLDAFFSWQLYRLMSLHVSSVIGKGECQSVNVFETSVFPSCKVKVAVDLSPRVIWRFKSPCATNEMCYSNKSRTSRKFCFQKGVEDRCNCYMNWWHLAGRMNFFSRSFIIPDYENRKLGIILYEWLSHSFSTLPCVLKPLQTLKRKSESVVFKWHSSSIHFMNSWIYIIYNQSGLVPSREAMDFGTNRLLIGGTSSPH